MPVNGMKASDFNFTANNRRLGRFEEIKSFYLSRKLEVPPRVLEEYSDILE